MIKDIEKKPDSRIIPRQTQFKRKVREFIKHIKDLQGDPHYIAMGMAIGVFVGFTPTLPFHTIIAILLAFVLRGSKPAAIIGVWSGNPVTIPFFYIGSYKVGMFIHGNSAPFDIKYESITELLDLGLDVTLAMITGGVIIGVLPAIATYFITRQVVITIRSRAKLKHQSSTAHPKGKQGLYPNPDGP
jgi:uncharacterized protein (DUF2062 family)